MVTGRASMRVNCTGTLSRAQGCGVGASKSGARQAPAIATRASPRAAAVMRRFKGGRTCGGGEGAEAGLKWGVRAGGR